MLLSADDFNCSMFLLYEGVVNVRMGFLKVIDIGVPLVVNIKKGNGLQHAGWFSGSCIGSHSFRAVRNIKVEL